MIKRTLKVALALLLAILFFSSAGFVVWANTPQTAMPEAIRALKSDEQVLVDDHRWLVFSPREIHTTTGIIFYPGGRIDPRAYAPMLRELARRGYFAVITPMPLSLAFFGVDQALDVIRAYPSVKHWAIGGHSLGGVAAASFAKNHGDKVQALVLLASYPADYDDLKGSTVRVLSISGTRDELSTPAKINASRRLLPPGTTWVEIQGANHGQFGWYGVQSGDGTASISREQQQDLILDATADILKVIGGE